MAAAFHTAPPAYPYEAHAHGKQYQHIPLLVQEVHGDGDGNDDDDDVFAQVPRDAPGSLQFETEALAVQAMTGIGINAVCFFALVASSVVATAYDCAMRADAPMSVLSALAVAAALGVVPYVAMLLPVTVCWHAEGVAPPGPRDRIWLAAALTIAFGVVAVVAPLASVVGNYATSGTVGGQCLTDLLAPAHLHHCVSSMGAFGCAGFAIGAAALANIGVTWFAYVVGEAWSGHVVYAERDGAQ